MNLSGIVDSCVGMLDTWPERSAALGAALAAWRSAAWVFRRRNGRKPAPIIAWLAEVSASTALLLLTRVQLKTAMARIAKLEAEITAAGIRSPSDGSAASGSVSLGEILTRSKPPSDPPSTST